MFSKSSLRLPQFGPPTISTMSSKPRRRDFRAGCGADLSRYGWTTSCPSEQRRYALGHSPRSRTNCATRISQINYQLKQRSLPGQIDAILRCTNSTVRLSNNHHASWSEQSGKIPRYLKRFVLPASKKKGSVWRNRTARMCTHRKRQEVDKPLRLSIGARLRQSWHRRIPPALDSAQQDDRNDRPALCSRITRSLRRLHCSSRKVLWRR